MMDHIKNKNWNTAFFTGAVVLILAGIVLRARGILTNSFVMYDEGMFLAHGRELLESIQANPPADFPGYLKAIEVVWHSALTAQKALWLFILELRVFWGGPDQWAFSRVVSLVAGVLTLGICYAWAHRYFKDRVWALLSVVFLALLPSNVYYSRLGMQEALSGLVFAASFYFFYFSKEPGWRIVLSGVLAAAVYLINYRLIFLPVFFLGAEVFRAVLEGMPFRWRALVWHTLSFFIVVVGVGSLYGGVNLFVNFAWYFHQGHCFREGVWTPWNFLSFPLMIFWLEGFLFALLFWANTGALFFGRRKYLFPFVFVFLVMMLFSIGVEAGARFLCFLHMFMAMAAASAARWIWEGFPSLRTWTASFLVISLISMGWGAWEMSRVRADYEPAAAVAAGLSAGRPFATTQPTVMGLFTPKAVYAQSAPADLKELLVQYQQGIRVLVVDPQKYISWTVDGFRFTELLPLYRLLEKIPPRFKFSHYAGPLMIRHVWDHNENLLQTLRFLKALKRDQGELRIYLVEDVFRVLNAQRNSAR